MGNKHAQTIREFYRHAKRMPTYREMLRLFGYHSKNAVYKLLKKLEKFEVVRKDKSHKLVPGRLFHAVIVAGTVEAGFPSPAEEELSDTMSLDEYLIKNKEATYMLKVSGDSMIDAGIMQGDMVLVERGTEAKDGQIVVAEVDGQWTMKYFRKRRSKVFLEAANKKYKPIYPKENLKIAAVVMAVIRRY